MHPSSTVAQLHAAIRSCVEVDPADTVNIAVVYPNSSGALVSRPLLGSAGDLLTEDIGLCVRLLCVCRTGLRPKERTGVAVTPRTPSPSPFSDREAGDILDVALVARDEGKGAEPE